MVGTNPTLASGGMARLADRMAAMVRETAMPNLAADGIFAAAAALIFNVLSNAVVSVHAFTCRPPPKRRNEVVAVPYRATDTAEISDDGKT